MKGNRDRPEDKEVGDALSRGHGGHSGRAWKPAVSEHLSHHPTKTPASEQPTDTGVKHIEALFTFCPRPWFNATHSLKVDFFVQQNRNEHPLPNVSGTGDTAANLYP